MCLNGKKYLGMSRKLGQSFFVPIKGAAVFHGRFFCRLFAALSPGLTSPPSPRRFSRPVFLPLRRHLATFPLARQRMGCCCLRGVGRFCPAFPWSAFINGERRAGAKLFSLRSTSHNTALARQRKGSTAALYYDNCIMYVDSRT
jgi:hypothetical protein